jgi:predicted glutamine amidotransferase
MCKVFVINDMSKLSTKQLPKVVETIAEHITKSERHGFGYAIQGTNGLFGERTTEPSEYKYSFSKPMFEEEFIELTYNRIGKPSKITGAGIFHGRTSTNHVNITNTHPIVKHGWTLIHNGVVTNQGKKYTKITSNDTEDLVHYMAKNGIKGVEKYLSGYYAFAAFDPDGILHIARDSMARLVCAYVKDLESIVFATTKELLNSVAKELKWNMSAIGDVIDDVYMTFNGTNRLSLENIKPRGYSTRESNYMSSSLSYLTGSGYDDFGYGSSYSNSKAVSGTATVKRDMDKEDLENAAEYYKVNLESDDYKAFREEVKLIDSSYKVRDAHHRPVDVMEFLSFTEAEQLDYEIVRPDGTILCPWNYFVDRLAS